MESWKHTNSLIEAAKDGDRRAFDDLVSRYTDSLKSFFRRQVGGHIWKRVEVEDLLQETFIRAFQSIGQFRGKNPGAFWGWLSTIAERVVLDHARKLRSKKDPGDREVSLEEKHRAKGGESWNLEKALEARGGSPSQALRRNERFERLKRTLKTLQPDHARVIFLARLQGLPIKEVARRMDRTPEATSMLLLRALMKLKARFGNTESLHLPDRSLEEEGDRYGG